MAVENVTQDPRYNAISVSFPNALVTEEGAGGSGVTGSSAPVGEQQVASAGSSWTDFEGKPIGGPPAQQAQQPEPATPTPPTYQDDEDIPAEGRALLELISGPESKGHYDIRYTPSGGARDFDLSQHPRIRERIPTGPYAGMTSDAAGKYQMLSSTWDPIAQKLGLTDFSEKSQDRGAWTLAQDAYRLKTGRELLQDMRNGGADLNALRGQWATLPKAYFTAASSPGPSQPGPSGAQEKPGPKSSWTELDPNPPPGTVQPPAPSPNLWSARSGANPEFDKERFDRAFDRVHSIDRDGWLWSLGASVLPGINEGLADILGLPGAAVHDAMLAVGAGKWFSPLPWKEPAKSAQTLSGALNLLRPPMPSEMRGYGRDLGIKFGPVNESAAAGIGHSIGTTIGATAPLAAVGAAWPEFLPARLGAEARTSPGKFLATEGVVEPAAAGFGAGDVGELYRDLQGEQSYDPTTQSIVAGVGGLLLSPRIPITGWAAKTSMRVINSVYQRAREIAGFKLDPAAVASMTPEQARLAVGNVISKRLTDSLDEAKYRVATMTDPRQPELAGLTGSQIQTRAAELVSQELRGWLRDGAETERALWASVPGDLPRDFSRAAGEVAKMRADFAGQVKDNLRDSADWPTKIGRLFDEIGKGPGNIEIGKTVHSRIQQAIREEAAAPAPSRARIGFLRRMDDALMADLTQSDPNGAVPDAIKAYRNASAFSRSFAELRNSNELFDVLARDKSGADRISAAETLDRLLKTGQAGLTAARQLQGAAEMRYGPDRMIGAVKDALRQKYLDQVAPNGYVSMQDHQQFMQKYGPLMSNERFADLGAEFNQAAASEQRALEGLSLGNNRTPTFGKSLNAADARQSRAELWLDNPIETVFGGLMRAPNQANAANTVIRQLQRDPTGDAVKGFSHITADLLLDYMRTHGAMGGSAWIKQNAGLMAAIDRVNPGFTERAQSLGDLSTSAGKLNFGVDLAMRWAGSQAFEHLTKGVGSRLVMASAGSRAFRQLAENMTAGDAMRVTAAAIADPAVYAQMQKFAVTGALKDISLIHLYVPGLAIPAAQGSLGLNDEQRGEIESRAQARPQKTGAPAGPPARPLTGAVPIAPGAAPPVR